MPTNKFCLCLTDLNHEHWSEWKHNFSDFNNVRIVPNTNQYKKPERLNVHYPLVRFIARGDLYEKGFKDFKQNSVLVLCNLTIPLSISHNEKHDWKDKRPDIICLSSSGKVFVIECKPRAELNDQQALEKDIKSFITFKQFAASDPIEYKGHALLSSVDKLESLYNNRYPRHLRFPNFRDTMNKVLGLKTERTILLWADKTMEHIRNDQAYFGFAFNGLIDEKTNRSLAYFLNCFESSLGQRNQLFYFTNIRDELFDVINARKA